MNVVSKRVWREIKREGERESIQKHMNNSFPIVYCWSKGLDVVP